MNQDLEKVEINKGVYIGLDLGQASDYTAIVVLQHVGFLENLDRLPENLEPRDPNQALTQDEYHLRYIAREQLGTSYVEVIPHVKALLDALRPLGTVTLCIDSTGVGAPIVDMFKAAGLNPVAITVHGGQNVNYDKGVWRVPKRDLVSSAKRLLGEKTLKIAKGMPFADTLINELQSFSVKINIATGHDTYEAWRENEHDDLVFAVSLCCWYVLKRRKDFMGSIDASEIVGDTSEGAVHIEDDYRIGWVPARNEEYGVRRFTISIIRLSSSSSGPNTSRCNNKSIRFSGQRSAMMQR